MKRRDFLKAGLGATAGVVLSSCQSGPWAPKSEAAAPLVASPPKSPWSTTPLVLHAAAFGVVGDGKTDDGPAVLRMLDKASAASRPARLQFEPGNTYFLATGRGRYAFPITGARELTIDGGGSVFLIDAKIRFLSLAQSSRITVRNLKVDYAPLPFADGVIIGKNREQGYVDVRIDPGMAMPPLGGPTHQDGEQAYFGLLWHEGPYSKVDYPYYELGLFYVNDVREASPGSLNDRVVRVMTNPQSALIDTVQVGVWRLSVPVRGIAHCYGPGETCVIADNEDVTFEDVEIWSAPWFAIGIHNNTGSLLFRRTHVRPRPGTTRLFSSARDGFHVKNNRATLHWDGCIVQGMGDDAFNISCHASSVRQVLSPTRIDIQQNFPLFIATMQVGDTLVAYHETRGVLLGRAQIASVSVKTPGDNAPGVERSPVFEVELSHPIPGIEAEATLIWNATCANPHNTLSNCRVDSSSRMHSPVTITDCHMNALVWFTGDEVEAPIPSGIVVRNTTFQLGTGNPRLAVSTNGPVFAGHGPSEPVIFNVLYENNRIYGEFGISDAANVHLIGNQFVDKAWKIQMSDIRAVRLRGNTYGGAPLVDVKDIVTANAEDAAAITFVA